MTAAHIDVRGRKVSLLEAGSGKPLIYLHGFADVHSLTGDLHPFHRALAGSARLIAPAHPGVGDSADLEQGYGVSDVVFHTLEVIDQLGLKSFDLVGHCVGGWIAAEIAVLIPERVDRLALIGATGLFVPGEHIADVFMHAQPDRGVDYTTLRHMLFAGNDAVMAQRYFPDRRAEIDVELRRYQMLRFASTIGFKPPYLYHRSLRDRLHRAKMPATVIWGEHDHFVPCTHGEAYAQGLTGSAGRLAIVNGAGHSAPLEAPVMTARQVLALLGDP